MMLSKILSLILTMTMILSSCAPSEPATVVKAAYVANSGGAAIELIGRTVRNSDNIYADVVRTVIDAPDDLRYTSVFPSDTTVENADFYETYANYIGIVIVELSGGYSQLRGIDKTIADYCITLSLCEFPEVSGVVVCDEPLAAMQSIDVMTPNDIVMNASALRTSQHTLKLWYPEGNELVENERTVVATADTEPAEVIVRALIDASNSDGVDRFIDSAAELYSAYIDDGVCYLDLSNEFMRFQKIARTGENLTVGAIVRSLCELDNIESVQFLIEGTVPTAVELLSQPLTYDE